MSPPQASIPLEPWIFAGGRVWLDRVVEEDQEETLRYLEECDSTPLPDSRKVVAKTDAYRKYAFRLWDSFCEHVLKKANLEAIVLDLCRNLPSAECKFRAFLRHYVKTSKFLRPSLGPQEYEWVREVESATTVTEFWKALVAEFNCELLQAKRQDEPEKASLYTLKFSDNAKGSGSVWKISKWIREDLAEEMHLSRAQMFEKREATAEDVLAVLTVLWTRPDVVSCSPTERVTFHFMILLAAIGAFRPGAISRILYRQVELAVVVDASTSSVRLVANITIIHNKTDKNALQRSQDDRITFAVTFAPCPLVCVLSLIIAKAIKDDAFDVGFNSLHALLTRPVLGGSMYLPIRWKEGIMDKPLFELSYHRLWEIWNSCTWALGLRDPLRPYSMRVGGAGRLDGVLTSAVRNFVVDNSSEVFERSYLPTHFRGQLAKFAFDALAGSYDALFGLLCNASLKADMHAPMAISAQEKAAFEERADLRAIAAKLEGDGQGEPPRWREALHSRTLYIRRSLTKQLMQRNRKEYFARVDRERALGISCAGPAAAEPPLLAIPGESCPFEGAESLGSFLRHFSTTKDLRLDRLKAYSAMLIAYLRFQPAEVAYLAYTEVRGAAPPGADPISLRPRDSASSSWCLLGCGQFSRRPGLTRHVKKIHGKKSGTFAAPFECPECRRLGWLQPVSLIESVSGWSAHIEVHHDERDAPNCIPDEQPASGSPTAGCPTSGSPPTPADPSATEATCFICRGSFRPKGLYIHYYHHKADPRFQGPFECPECTRTGQQTKVEGFAEWRKHSDEVHGCVGATLDDVARIKAKKRFREEDEDAEAKPPAKHKRLERSTDQASHHTAGISGKGEPVWKKHHYGDKDNPIVI